MATVYRGYDTRLECDVAIKFICRDKINPSQWEKTRIRFDQEAKRMAKLNHPHIVRVIDYGEYNNMPFLVMPFLAGGSLKDVVKALNGKGMDYRQACTLLIPIAQALDYAHHMILYIVM
jgi:serine/threonine protein kinase